MRITIDVPEGLMDELVRVSGKRKRTEAVRIALEEYIRHRKIERLLDLPGKIEVNDVTAELEELELLEHRSID